MLGIASKIKNTNTLTRNPDFFYFIDHGKGSLFTQDYKGPLLFSPRVLMSLFFSLSIIGFGFQLKGSKVQGYQISTRCLSRHCTYNIFSNQIVYN